MAKRCIREWFTGELRAGVLSPSRGCTRVVTDIKSGEEKSSKESWRSLIVNIGDRVILFGASHDQIQSAEVRSILDGGSRFSLSLGYGAVNDGRVHVLKAGKAA